LQLGPSRRISQITWLGVDDPTTLDLAMIDRAC